MSETATLLSTEPPLTYIPGKTSLACTIQSSFEHIGYSIVDWAQVNLSRFYLVVEKGCERSLILCVAENNPLNLQITNEIQIHRFHEDQLDASYSGLFLDCPSELIDQLTPTKKHAAKKIRQLILESHQKRNQSTFAHGKSIVYLNKSDARFFSDNKKHKEFVILDPQSIIHFGLNGSRVVIPRSEIKSFNKADIHTIESESEIDLISYNQKDRIRTMDRKVRNNKRSLIAFVESDAPYYRKSFLIANDAKIAKKLQDKIDHHNETNEHPKSNIELAGSRCVELTAEFNLFYNDTTQKIS